MHVCGYRQLSLDMIEPRDSTLQSHQTDVLEDSEDTTAANSIVKMLEFEYNVYDVFVTVGDETDTLVNSIHDLMSFNILSLNKSKSNNLIISFNRILAV